LGIQVLVFFVAGLAALIFGAEALVRGSTRLAIAVGVSPLVIGLTVVAWGTGSPELAVGVGAALNGQPDLTIGNVIGSNIANVLLVLGLAAAVAPLRVSDRLVRLDVPIMIVVSVATWLLSLDGRLGRFDGIVLFSGIVAYTVMSIRLSRRSRSLILQEYEKQMHGDLLWRRQLVYLVYVAGGLAMLTVGAGWLVDGASAIAEALGVSKLVIGLTIVAIGTSLPEVATSAVASFRGERDIAVGNVVGSNIFNILAVLGATAIIAPGGISVSPDAIGFDMPVMIVVAIACLPVFLSGSIIDRWEGFLFLACYASYLAYLVLQTTQHNNAAGFRAVLVLFVLPAVAVALVVISARALRERRAIARGAQSSEEEQSAVAAPPGENGRPGESEPPAETEQSAESEPPADGA
jgi:cation:H+ antiporter